MNLRVLSDGNIVSYNNIEYNENNREFILYSANDEIDNLFLTTDYDYDTSTDYSKFIVYVLYSKIATENSIYRIIKGEEKIGYIFPANSALSSYHDFSDDARFLRYAYASIIQFFLNYDGEISNFDNNDIFSSIIGEDAQFLVLYKDDINNKELFPNGFLLENYIPYFLGEGYSVVSRDFSDYSSMSDGKVYHLKETSESIRGKEYINLLFSSLIPRSEDDLARFHTLYQVVEVLIDNIFRVDFKRFIDSLQKEDELEYLSEANEKLREIYAEKDRVRELFSSWIIVDNQNREDLAECCKIILDRANFLVKKETLGDYIYGVRCLLVHSMYKIDSFIQEKLHDLNILFLDVLVDAVISFRDPVG